MKRTKHYTIGMDLGDSRHTVGVLNAGGEIVAEEQIVNARATLETLSPVRHRSEGAQRALVRLKVREALVRNRANLINYSNQFSEPPKKIDESTLFMAG